jgi:hypothetical protein
MDHRLNLLLCFGRIALPQKRQKSYLIVRGLAVEIVWNPYVFPLCVVTNFARGCYVCHCSRRWRNMSAGLTIFVSLPFSGCEDLEIIFANANCLQ